MQKQKSTQSDASLDGELPISEYRSEIVKLVKENLFSIITGETGSGKSTQIAQFMVDGIGQTLDLMDEEKFKA